jgi:hypothetical protein
VLFQGQPLPGGRIFFVTERGERLGTDLKEDGTYSLASLPPGTLRVGVDNTGLWWLEQLRQGKRPEMPPAVVNKLPDGVPPYVGRYVPLPDRYRDPDSSGLEATIRPGVRQQDFNLD